MTRDLSDRAAPSRLMRAADARPEPTIGRARSNSAA